jgi:hypothetical protein
VTAFALADFQRIVLPSGGVWRVTDWPEPFEPPPAPPPIRSEVEDDDAGRWDAPDGSFRTLYCATEAEGAVGEKLGPFALNPAAVRRIERFFDEEPDDEYLDDDLSGVLRSEDFSEWGWSLAWASVHPGASAIDVFHWRTAVAALPHAAPLLRSFGLRSLDRYALLEARRDFTRQLGAIFRERVTSLDGSLQACGLCYESRLPPAWECWAPWEPVPVDPDPAQLEALTITHPVARSAAAKLGVILV